MCLFLARHYVWKCHDTDTLVHIDQIYSYPCKYTLKLSLLMEIRNKNWCSCHIYIYTYLIIMTETTVLYQIIQILRADIICLLVYFKQVWFMYAHCTYFCLQSCFIPLLHYRDMTQSCVLSAWIQPVIVQVPVVGTGCNPCTIFQYVWFRLLELFRLGLVGTR